MKFLHHVAALYASGGNFIYITRYFQTVYQLTIGDTSPRSIIACHETINSKV